MTSDEVMGSDPDAANDDDDCKACGADFAPACDVDFAPTYGVDFATRNRSESFDTEDSEEDGVRFLCHCCRTLISEGSPVYMRRDASYCSPTCRRKGRFPGRGRKKEGPLGRTASGSLFDNLSSYLSNTISVSTESSATGSKKSSRGAQAFQAGRQLLRGVMSWVVGKAVQRLVTSMGDGSLVRGVSSVAGAIGADASFGSHASFEGVLTGASLSECRHGPTWGEEEATESCNYAQLGQDSTGF